MYVPAQCISEDNCIDQDILFKKHQIAYACTYDVGYCGRRVFITKKLRKRILMTEHIKQQKVICQVLSIRMYLRRSQSKIDCQLIN